MRKLATLILVIIPLLTGCAEMAYNPGLTTGAGVGATAGALLDHGNRWRGAAIGGILGGALGSQSDHARRYNRGDDYNYYRQQQIERERQLQMEREREYRYRMEQEREYRYRRQDDGPYYHEEREYHEYNVPRY